MAPKQQQPVFSFSANERVLCFHLEMLYEAKVLEVGEDDNGKPKYKIHYKGWKSSWDDWVGEDRIRKFTDENRELATTLAQQSKALHAGKSGNKPPKGKGLGGRGAGSDLSSARGSEERAAGTTTQSGRGPRRARDFELETDS
ncbi:Chromo domain-like protein [Rhypophila sp. PSN 637]